MRHFKLQTNVASTQAANCIFCFHIWSIALLIGRRHGPCYCRIELFTPLHLWRISKSRWKVATANNSVRDETCCCEPMHPHGDGTVYLVRDNCPVHKGTLRP